MKIDNIFLKKVVYLLGRSTKKIPFMVILFISMSVIDVLSIGLVAPYLTLILSPEIILENEMFNLLVTLGIPSDPNTLVIFFSFLLFGVFLVKSIAGVLINRAILVFCIDNGSKLRSFLMRSYQKMPYEKYVERNSSEYIYQIQELAVNFSHTTLQAILRIASEGVVLIAIVVFLASVDPLAVLTLVGLISTSVLIYYSYFKNKVNRYGKEVNLSSKKMIQGVNEGIEGLKEIRVLGKENYFYNIVKDNAIKYSQINVKASVVKSIPKYMMELLMVSFMVAIVITYVSQGKDFKLLLPTLGVFAIAGIRLIPSSNLIISSVVQISFGRNAVDLLYDDVKNFENKTFKTESLLNNGNISNVDIFDSIELHNVTYKYPTSNLDVLTNVSLKIKSGESIGIIGTSGSGKTTLIDIILGLFEPASGDISVNNKIINVNNSRWRKNIAYLPQQIFLIDNTLRNNIALGEEESEIDDVKILSVIDQVQLTDVVSQLPDGLDTFLGERGVRLSGGQRQRIALARALYHNRNILIMDESTSALDNETEAEIVKEIKLLKGKKTVIVIAHRLTTLKHCDRIYKLDNGSIVDVGSYQHIVGDVNS